MNKILVHFRAKTKLVYLADFDFSRLLSFEIEF